MYKECTIKKIRKKNTIRIIIQLIAIKTLKHKRISNVKTYYYLYYN